VGEKMGKKKSKKMSLSTFFLILAIFIIAILAYFVYKFYKEEKLENEKNSNLNLQVSSNEDKKDNISNNIDSNDKDNELSTVEIGYNYIISVINGKPYVIPIYRADNYNEEDELNEGEIYYYNKYEINNIEDGVKEVDLEYIGLDPSETTYFIMNDGSLRILETEGTIENLSFTSTEVLSASNNVVDISDDSGFLYAITKEGKKIQIAEILN
jgi:hypothetical protein